MEERLEEHNFKPFFLFKGNLEVPGREIKEWKRDTKEHRD